MKRKYLAFDIETAKVQSTDERDWRAHRPLGISCAATLAAESGEPVLWHGVTKLIVRQAECASGKRSNWSSIWRIKFGMAIPLLPGMVWALISTSLRKNQECLTSARRLARDHVDMMFHVVCQLGFGVSLDSAAKGMGISGKLEGLNGAVVPRLWAEGRRQEVLEYVAQDVRITLELAKTCEACRHFRWVTRGGSRREMPLPRGWLSVSSAARLPEPDTTWMGNQWSRTAFTAWLR